MSNADDRCARRDCQASRMAHGMHMHVFVEPAPRPAPSGDEAKVREIAEKHMAGYGSVPVNYVERAAREAYAAGKADAFKECEGIARMLPQTPRVKVARAIADAIARRGSEGK